MNYLQLTIADASKLKCNFVLEAEKYFKNLKYVLDPSDEKLLQTFKEYLYSLNSCLDDDDICYLKELPKTKLPSTDCSSIFNCVDINAEVSFIENSCPVTTYVNPQASITLADNASSFNAVTDISWLSCSDGADLSFTSSTPFSTAGVISFDSSVQHLLSNQSYIRYLNLREALGLNLGAAFTADLTIGTSIYYSNNVSCPGCAAVNTSELYLSHANFPTAFATVLNNISLARFGATGRHNISIVKTGPLTFNIVNRVRHNPTSAIFGFNFASDLATVYNPNTASFINRSLTSRVNTPAVFSASTNINTACGITLAPSASGSADFSVSSTTNFNQLVLNSTLSTSTLSVTAPTAACKQLNYTGTYNSIVPNPTKGWYQGLTQLNSLNTLTISSAGTYTYKVISSSGCEDTVSVTIINQDLQ